MRRRLPNLPYEQDLELFLVGLKSRRFCDQELVGRRTRDVEKHSDDAARMLTES